MNELIIIPISWKLYSNSVDVLAAVNNENIFGIQLDTRIVVKINLSHSFIIKTVTDNKQKIDSIQYGEQDDILELINTNGIIKYLITGLSEDYFYLIPNLSFEPINQLLALLIKNNLNLYEKISINLYENQYKYKVTDYIQITVNEIDLKPTSDSPPSERLNPAELDLIKLYWDHEVFGDATPKAFPSALDPINEIFLTSIVFDDPLGSPDYLLTTRDTNFTSDNLIVQKMNSERDLIYSLWRLFDLGEKLFSYNGLTFDIPYTLDRMTLLGMKLPTLQRSNRVIVKRELLNIGFKNERILKLIDDFHPHLDMLYYFRKYYPWLPNFKLETIGKFFLNEGKTGFPISDLFEAYKTSDPKLMNLAADYSYQDSVLLSKLDKRYNILETLRYTSNATGLTETELLTKSTDEIIKNFVLYRYSFEYENGIEYNKSIKAGLYHNVYVYDLSNYLLNELDSEMNDYLKYAQTEIIWKIYHSKLGPENKLTENFINNDDIILVNKGYLFSLVELDLEPIDLLTKYDIYFAFSNSSYIIVSDNGNYFKGQSKLTSPKFNLARKYILQLLTGKIDKNSLLTVEVDMSDLILTKSVATDKESDLLLQYMDYFDLVTNTVNKVKLEYLETTEGPLLLELYDEDTILNYNWYHEHLDDIRLNMYKYL